MKRQKTIIFSILLIGLTYFAYLKLDKFIEIDKCLDKGSKWDYSIDKCACLNKKEIEKNENIIGEKNSEK